MSNRNELLARAIDLARKAYDGDRTQQTMRDFEASLVDLVPLSEQLHELLFTITLYAPNDGPEYAGDAELSKAITESGLLKK